MSHLRLVILHFVFVIWSCPWNAYGQGGFAYPGSIQDLVDLPLDNRLPLEMPSICDENELYYPGDQKDDWICDCIKGYIFYAPRNKCFRAYERGPCDTRYMLVLSDDGYTPRCKMNVCQDDQVLFKGACRVVGSPCDIDTRKVYGVNETTLKFECLSPYISFRGSDFPTGTENTTPIVEKVVKVQELRQPDLLNNLPSEVVNPAAFCNLGCKRSQNRKCPIGEISK